MKVESKGVVFGDVPRIYKLECDPKDEPYLNLAIEANADYLISRDRDLLDLMDWQQEVGREFQKCFRGLRIVTPEEFLRVMQLADCG